MFIYVQNCLSKRWIILFISLVMFAGCSSAIRREAAMPIAEDVSRFKEDAAREGKVIDKMALYWFEKVKGFRSDNKTQETGGIVLLGDSITEGFSVEKMFPEMHVINRGISGDKIGGWKYIGVLDRLGVSVYDLKPRKLFLLIGINDIVFWDTPPEEMARGYDKLLSELKRSCKGCEIYVQSLLPLRGKYAKHNQEALQFNKKIQEVAEKLGVTFLNVHPVFCDEDGELREELTYDGLHLSKAGYYEWRKILLPLF